MPIEFIPNTKYSYRRRYIASGSGNADFSITDLINSLIFAATTVLGYSPFYAIKLRGIRAWGPISTIGLPVSLSIFPKLVETDTNSLADIPMMISDTAVSIDRPAYVQWQPSKFLPAGSWHFTSSVSASLFKLAYPLGCVLELDISAVLNVQQSSLGFTSTLVGANVGGMYCRNVITNFVPVSVNVI